MDQGAIRIAYVLSDGEGGGDRLLSVVAGRAAEAGIALAGTVQRPVAEDAKCRILLTLLPDGPLRDISLDLGPGSEACRLDAGALEEAAQLVLDRLQGADALLVNRFGKQEASGRGLVAAMGEACGRGLPVLAVVAPVWLDAFLAFTGDQAVLLPAEEDALFRWLAPS